MFSRRDFLGMLSAAGALAAAQACSSNAPKLPSAHNAANPDNLPPLDRRAILQRHAPALLSADPAAVLSVGNGNFAFNVDATGLQSLAADYRLIPLTTLAHWAWHTLPAPAGLRAQDLRYKQFPFHGRTVPYATDSAGQKPLFDYLRENPHMLNLARIGLLFSGRPLALGQLSQINQQLDLYAGIITSRFSLFGSPVEVVTCCHADRDAIGIRISSALLATGRLSLQLSFPYGSAESSGADFTHSDSHSTLFKSSSSTQAFFYRILDATQYSVTAAWSQSTPAAINPAAPHTFIIAPTTELFEITIDFSRAEPPQSLSTFSETLESSRTAWQNFWHSGAAIDLSDCTDPRAPELERRIILSQYLTRIHCAGSLPSQETGLLCNSWYGKFHLEMHWWHSVHFTAWNRFPLFANSLPIYAALLDSARARAKSQGFAGARWPKMTGPDGQDSPSPVGPLIIWQQPHPIYYAELCYRHAPTRKTLQQWRDIVLATADFLASFAQFDPARDQFVLGPAIKTVSENNPTDTTLNPTYELTAWRFGLRTAQTWLERLGEKRNPTYDRVLTKLAPAPTRDGAYLFQANSPTYTKEWAYEHPALLGALGVLPGDGIDSALMAESVRRVRSTWDFSRVWGWDFPMAALAAARTLQPELAIDFLTMDAPMNNYLKNGCNFQRDNVPAYFPGNGGLLAAIAMMSAGWTGAPNTPQPGFPKNNQWNVRTENFNIWL